MTIFDSRRYKNLDKTLKLVSQEGLSAIAAGRTSPKQAPAAWERSYYWQYPDGRLELVTDECSDEADDDLYTLLDDDYGDDEDDEDDESVQLLRMTPKGLE